MLKFISYPAKYYVNGFTCYYQAEAYLYLAAEGNG